MTEKGNLKGHTEKRNVFIFFILSLKYMFDKQNEFNYLYLIICCYFAVLYVTHAYVQYVSLSVSEINNLQKRLRSNYSPNFLDALNEITKYKRK